MLKSTHKSAQLSQPPPAPLPANWSEHVAPNGKPYWYNTETKQSSWVRPAAAVPPPVPAPLDPSQSFQQWQSVGNGPVAFGPGIPPNQLLQPYGVSPFGQPHGPQAGNFPNQHSRPFQPARPKPQPTDKPRTKHEIPGHPDWLLIETKLQRRFVYNVKKNESYWRIPEKLKQPIIELDQARIREKAEAAKREQEKQAAEAAGAAERPSGEARPVSRGEAEAAGAAVEGDDDSEYEEVEVTDDEGEEEEAESAAKRQRIEDETPQEPAEFTEDDIAYQLAAMGQDYGLDPEEYGEYGEGEEEGLEFTEEDAKALFKDMLNDSGISPYKPWEVIIEEGKLFDDGRYTALTTMKARKETWDEWTAEKIKKIREEREKGARKDPKIPFLAFLQEKANPKLYWPEFKRKWRKEAEMKDTALSERDREKLYREHVARLKMPEATRKTEFLNLLKSQPLKVLNNRNDPSDLPTQILGDIKFISLDIKTRDRLVEEYISTLPAPPAESDEQEESEEVKKQKAERERREKALKERERRVAEEKRRQERALTMGRGRLREEEEEIRRAMDVGKAGLRGHLMEMDVDKKEANI